MKVQRGENMKKTVFWSLAAVLLLAGVLLYFVPMQLTRNVTEDMDIRMVLNVFSIEKGEPCIEAVEYQDMTAEQKHAVWTALGEYRYRRTPDTLFSNGTIEDLGERMLSIHGFDEAKAVTIVLTDSGRIAINDRSYRMSGAEELIGRILAVVE